MSSELEDRRRALESALHEFEHQARRIRDRLERVGGRSFALEVELEQVEENLKVTRRDIEKLEAQRRAATRDGKS
ncbi:MAG: hypothetical protein R3174_04995 [Gammaproteobacteria bacterium]|nr:hypothetical protein [Gammaproteobacteria bacterium]